VKWNPTVRWGALLLALTGCEGDRDAERLLGLIDRMRDAPLAERPRHIDALAAASAARPEAQAAQRDCLEAYRALQSAHEKLDAAKRLLDKQQAAGQPPRYEEISAVDAAMTDMTTAQQKEPACAAAVAALRRALER
jgi:hypothetical protein